MNIETNKQTQQQQQEHHKHQKQHPQQYQQQHQHHAHCSYDKDIVCDDAQMHKQKHQHHSHQPHAQSHQSNQCEKNKKTAEQQQHHQQQQQQQSHQHRSKQQQEQQQPSTTTSFSHRHHQHPQSQSQPQTQRKYSHSHSPHHSRHTSPHSHHSHSLHSSPHQSHQHVNGGSTHGGSGGLVDTLDTRHTGQRPSTQSSTSHAHHHHHHQRRRSRRNHNHNHGGNGSGSGGGSGNSSLHGPHGHSHNSQERSSAGSRQHNAACARRHRSATDISSVSLNTCHNENCIDREVQEIFVRKSCCSTSRTELAQYFAEDLYGSSRRPSSCCTSSDYCYQTDSTSLYGSRSSLSRNNSIKSASISMRKRRALHQRQPSYTSISLRGIQSSQTPSSSRQQQHGSLSTVFDRQKSKSTEAKHGEHLGGAGGGRVVLSPSKVTIERQATKARQTTSNSQELPDYACSPSPIRWSFLADEKIQAEMDAWKTDDSERGTKPPPPPQPPQPRKPCRPSKQQEHVGLATKAESTAGTSRKRRESGFSCEFEESSTTVLFHQEGEAYNNCCNNYIQCNTYLDQDLQITSEDIHQYLSKGQHGAGDILNNTKNYPFQPSNALEFHYKNNFANNNNATGSGTGTGTTAESTESCESVLAANGARSNFQSYRRNSSKETNLNQNVADNTGACGQQPTNINLSSSTNNINIIFNNSNNPTTSGERNANEVKFINTSGRYTSAAATTSHDIRLTDYRLPFDCANVSTKSYFDKTLGIDQLPKEFEASSAKPKTTVVDECGGGGIEGIEGSSSDGQHSSSPLPSPVQTGASFESFDAPSDHNLISQRGSCQFSSPTPRSPLSPASPACSSLSLNGAPSTFVVEPTQHHQTQHCYSYEQAPATQTSHGHQHQHRHQHHHHHHRQQHEHSPASTTPRSTHSHTHSHQNQDDYYQQHQQHQHHHHHHHHHSHHTNDSFKLSNAFKKVHKCARKYTDFLRKK